MEAAFKPEVNGELDTQNFMKCDELDPPASARTGSGSSRKMFLTPKDLSVVGYTYKNFDAVKGLHHFVDFNNPSTEQPSVDAIYSSGRPAGDLGVGYPTKWSAEETVCRCLLQVIPCCHKVTFQDLQFLWSGCIRLLESPCILKKVSKTSFPVDWWDKGNSCFLFFPAERAVWEV
ncbi:uncharacterized protein LOC120200970 isoform X2 [Hibiscus syriacus]|uniref:uncharacterized protein LOC120200970 isoform X2 n=1 Tax=Hibiscus syriacus TaxID=106335 RepID=UPI0019221369|nr:uncharacterized protein LOC120200970 isoform X2 [Hibiscus syriacus]